MGFLGHPGGADAELLDGTLKLGQRTTSFSKRFTLRGFFISTEGWLVKAHLVDGGGKAVKRVRLSRMTCPGILVHRTQGSQRQSDGKGWLPHDLRSWERGGRAFATIFLALGLVEVCSGEAWNLLSEVAPVRFELDARVRMIERTLICNITSAPQPPQPPTVACSVPGCRLRSTGTVRSG